ncbi:hypothetical protein NKI82_25920 [Mesorhizobium sp. M0482]
MKLDPAHRRLPQLRHQAVERGALRRDERGRAAFQRGGRRCLPLRQEPVLRLVSGTTEAGVHGHGRGGQSRACVAYVLDEIYKLLHPMMPFPEPSSGWCARESGVCAKENSVPFVD